MTPAENPTLAYIAIPKRGASLSGHKYGVYTKERLPSVLTIATVAAFFSSVCPRTLAAHARLTTIGD
jgi:hypothetical protein